MRAIPAGVGTILGFGLLLHAAPLPASAQSVLGAVACVGTEPKTAPGADASPIVYVDREFKYLVGLDVVDRELAERSLRSQLGGHPAVLCAWSGLGDSHLVIVGHDGRGSDPDPDGRGFRAFSVGYGTSWRGAEFEAVSSDIRFETYRDGPGYEVLVRETWTEEDAAGRTSATKLAPGQVFQECAPCPRMVVLPARSFRMGSRMGEWDRQANEMSVRRARIPAPFAVGIHEVTFAEWDACVAAGGCGGYRPNDEGWGRGTRPVVNVSQRDARRYARWLSERTGEEYRLPTEAEWEYAARAGTLTARHWGEGERSQCWHSNGWGEVAQCSDGHDHTAPVGSYIPNAFGLYDVLGNAWEWTESCWRGVHVGMNEAERDRLHSRRHLGFIPFGALRDCSRGVLRGGSWHSGYENIRSASRLGLWGGIRLDYNGFRVVRSIG